MTPTRWPQFFLATSRQTIQMTSGAWRFSEVARVRRTAKVTQRKSTDYTHSSIVYVQSNALTTKLSVQRRFPHTYPLHCWCIWCAILVHWSDLYNEVFFEGPHHSVLKAFDCAVPRPSFALEQNLSNHKRLAPGGHVQVAYQCAKRNVMALKNDLLTH